MSPTEIWLTIVGMGCITVITRTSFFMLPDRFQLPPRIQRALRYAPACALVAIIVPDLLLARGGAHPGTLDLSMENARLVAALIAMLVFFYKRDMLLMIVVGMLTFSALRWTG